MRDAVILATSRTPIGRAFKGSLVDVRPDDMSAFVIDDVLSKVPAVDPGDRRGRHLGLRAARRRGGLQHRPRGGDPGGPRRPPA